MEEPIDVTEGTVIDGLEPIETHIREQAQGIAEKKLIPEPVLARVSGLLIDKIREKSQRDHDYLKQKPLVLLKSDVKEIGAGLIVGNPVSYQTWLHRDSFNWVVFILNIDRTLKSPFFNIPQQIQRMLIIHMDRQVLKNVQYILAIREELLALDIGDVDSQKDNTDDCLCAFLASAMLFGEMTFPKLEKIFAWLRFCDISLSPVSLSLKLNNSDEREIAAFFRNFLPAPASNYFLRLMLACFKNDRAARGRAKVHPSDSAFPGLQNNLNKIHYIFEKWTKKTLQLRGIDTTDGISLETFRKAAMLLSVLELPAAGERLYPPFLLSVLSRGIVSDSVSWKYFIHCPEPCKVETLGQEECSLGTSVNKTESSTPFHDALADVMFLIRTPLRREAHRDTRSLKAKRMEIVAGLKSIKERCRAGAGVAEYENIVFFIAWLESLFCRSKPSIKTITNYAKDAQDFLAVVPEAKSITTLGNIELVKLLRQVMDEKNSSAITDGLRSFLYYVEVVTGTFNGPNWRCKELRKEEMPSQKPLVFPEQVQAALDNMGLFFFRHLGRYVDKEAYIKNYRIASHKSEIIFHLVMLAFYTGLRIIEFRSLLIGNVIYDDGIMLCILTSKTSNGVRNIPLSTLLPQWYLEEFLAYWRRRKGSAKADDLLFPRHDGKFIDKSYLTNEIKRLFESVGVPKVTAHILRHAFPNWFLLRWFFIFYPEYKADDIPFFKYELFQEELLTRFKKLFPLDCFTDMSPISHALAVLARLLGHGGPIVSLEKYVHVTDWIFHFMSKRFEEKKVSITSRQAEQLLQVSYPTLPDALKGRGKKTLTYKKILSYQVKEFKKKNLQASRFMFGSDSELDE